MIGNMRWNVVLYAVHVHGRVHGNVYVVCACSQIDIVYRQKQREMLYEYMNEARIDLQYVSRNIPCTRQIRGKWTKQNKIEEGVVTPHSQIITTKRENPQRQRWQIVTAHHSVPLFLIINKGKITKSKTSSSHSIGRETDNKKHQKKWTKHWTI